jgi:hypothetical protein
MTTPIGFLYRTAMPDLTDVADIQEALRIYHYGAPTGAGEGFYNPGNTDPTNLVIDSVAYHLYNLQEQLDNFTTGILTTAWTAKGALISADAPGAPRVLDVGGPGQVLSVNPGQPTGLEWKTLDVTLTNEVILANKTLSQTNVLQPGIKFLGNTGNSFFTTVSAIDPTANRTIFLPDESATLIGNSTNDTLTNKTISLQNNTVTGNVSQFNTALTDASFLTTLATVTIGQGGTGASTSTAAKTNLDIFRNASSVAFGGKVYVANPATVGATGASLTGAVAGDLWFW